MVPGLATGPLTKSVASNLAMVHLSIVPSTGICMLVQAPQLNHAINRERHLLAAAVQTGGKVVSKSLLHQPLRAVLM